MEKKDHKCHHTYTYKYLPCEFESSDEDVLECALRSFPLFEY